MKKPLQLGDVFTSRALANCVYDSDMKGLVKTKISTADSSGIDRIQFGVGRRAKVVSNKAPSFADKKFIVVRAEMEGGASGEGMSGHESWPDGWFITARMLNSDGTYNPDGIELQFAQSGSFTGMIIPRDIELAGHMRMWFLRDDEVIVKKGFRGEIPPR
jgi:hypothetical protein